ncbi:MAG TPA: alpha/beta fold hydrolase [Solirubrobacteraceae bacterium]|nr:alpha/beta fold hydrolase [Solirubrobacteraceae bacterium]
MSVDGCHLRYIEAGEGEPLVWLHGGGGLHPSTGTDLLTASFRVVAIELPGFGSSRRPDGARTFDELSEQVAVGIDALGLSRYILHGTSFGGATALHLALNHPDRIERLILESPAAFRPPGWTPPDMETVRRGLFRHPERARRVQIDPEMQRLERELVGRLSLTVDREALAARLRDLRVPTLVMFGDADTLTPPDLSRMYCDNAPDCESVVIPDAAHVISSDQPEPYAATVREFALGESPGA